jgi:hypothetical protein
MSASSATEYPVLQPTDSISVNEATEYQPANQPVQPEQSHSVKYNPVNGNLFTKNSDFIQFTIRPQARTWLDGSKSTLNLKFKALPDQGTGTTAMSTFSTRCGIQGAISRLVVTNSGNTLEDVTSYNRAYALVNNMYASTSQLRSAPSVRDITSDGEGALQPGRQTGRRMTTATADSATLTCNEYECSVPISLSSLFGPSSRKSLPLGKITEPIDVKIYLTSHCPEVYYSKTGASGTAPYDLSLSDYQITSVSLECHQVRFSESVTAVVDAATGSGSNHEWDADQLSSSLNNITPSLSQDQILLSNTQYRDCKSIMNQTWYSEITGSTMTYASVQPGVYKYNVSCDGQFLLSRDVGNNNLAELHNSDALMVANLLSITRNACDLWEGDVQLNNGAYHVGRFNPYAISTPTGSFPAAGPNGTPTCNVNQFRGDAVKPTDPDCYYTGISTLTSKDMSRKLTGTDFKGKQIVVHVRRHNAILSTSAKQIYHSVLHIGCKIILENGELRREC